MNEWSYKLELSLKTNYLGWFLHTWYLKIHTFIVTSKWMSRHLFWYGGLCSFTNIKVATNSVDIMPTHGKAIANLYEDLLITASPLMPSRRQKVWPRFFFFFMQWILHYRWYVLVVCPADYWPVMVALGFFGIPFFFPLFNVDSSDASYLLIELLQVDSMRYKLWRLRSLHL